MSSRTLQRQITGAMAQQLDRVNHCTTNQRIAELEQEIAHLHELLQIARERIAVLELQLPAQPGDGGSRPASTLLYKGRPATTVQRAAAFYGVHPSTIIRRLQPGSRQPLAGEQLPGSNRWIVFLDDAAAFRRYVRQ